MWDKYIHGKIRSSFLSNVRLFVNRHLHKFKMEQQRYNSNRIISRMTKTNINSLAYLSVFAFIEDSYRSEYYSPFVFLCKSRCHSLSMQLFLRTYVLVQSSRVIILPPPYDRLIIRAVYQIVDKIDMCIRIVSSVRTNIYQNYFELCRSMKQELYSSFHSYYRPYISVLFHCALLSVPSMVGGDILAKLPDVHKELIHKIAYSANKLGRYKKYLVKSGILKMPSFAVIDGIFSCYYRDH
jgi:hypothetical protein